MYYTKFVVEDGPTKDVNTRGVVGPKTNQKTDTFQTLEHTLNL